MTLVVHPSARPQALDQHVDRARMVALAVDEDRDAARRSVAAAMQRHLDAGADHVRIDAIDPDLDGGVEQITRLDSALDGLRPR